MNFSSYEAYLQYWAQRRYLEYLASQGHLSEFLLIRSASDEPGPKILGTCAKILPMPTKESATAPPKAA
jgi:hypothetical protein